MSTILRTIGIDISKDWLDAFAAPEGKAARFSNDSAGFRKLIVWVGSEVDRIAYEPSGAFHRDLEDTLLKAGLPLYAINPFQVRSFARSLGRRAKTDAVDARMLASMAAAIEDLRPTEARSEGQRALAELQQIRDALRKDRVATINRGKHLRTPMGKRLNKQRLRQVDRQLKLIDAEIRRRLGEEKTLERRAEILTSIPGISDITAAGLIVLMPELGTLTGARAASLAGLAPITRESGHWKGRSFIQGGRHRVRRLLFMPALVAVQHNPDLKRKYEALVAKGKPPKVALTAVMRKLLLLADAPAQRAASASSMCSPAPGKGLRAWMWQTRPMSRMPEGFASTDTPCATRARTARRTFSWWQPRKLVHCGRVNTPPWRQAKAIHSARRPVQPKGPSASSRPFR